MSVRVGRLRKDKGISVARPTALGNSFEVGKPYTRAEAISRYRAWFAAKLRSRDPDVMRQLGKIVSAARAGDVTLLCYCDPLPCHAAVIAEYVRAELARGERGF